MNLAQKLGYAKDARLLIIHADDAGLAHSQNRAITQSLQTGLVNSFSIMVPCPWFYEMALFARSHPQFDSGIHLTLTCEWKNYKFGPVLSPSEVPSLVNIDGHFYKTREELKKNATAEDVAKELEAQIEKALKFGLAPSHIDSHMYSVGANADFISIYRGLGEKYNLPVLFNGELLEMVGLNPEFHLQDEDLVVDKVHIASLPHFEPDKLWEYYAEVVQKLVNGLNVLLIHPAFDDNEMKGITVNHPNFGSAWRQIDFDSFNSNEMKQRLSESDVKLVTWYDIKTATNMDDNL